MAKKIRNSRYIGCDLIGCYQLSILNIEGNTRSPFSPATDFPLEHTYQLYYRFPFHIRFNLFYFYTAYSQWTKWRAN